MPKSAQSREIELEPPLAGQSEDMGFEQQQPYSTPFMQNVRIQDPDEQRSRMGQRAGTTKAYSTQAGGAHPIVAMASITTTFIKAES